MKTFQQQFILRLLVISVVVFGALYIVFTKYITAALPLVFMVSLLFAINALAYMAITNTRDKKPGAFVYTYMAISMGRLLICAAFVFIYAFMHRENARTFAITFFVLYFLYTTIEIRAIYSFFKQG